MLNSTCRDLDVSCIRLRTGFRSQSFVGVSKGEIPSVLEVLWFLGELSREHGVLEQNNYAI